MRGVNKKLALSSFCFIALFLCTTVLIAQSKKIDSLRALLKTHKDDTNKVNILADLAATIYNTNPDSIITPAREAEALATKLNWPKGIAQAENYIGIWHEIKGDYSAALDCYKKSLAIKVQLGNKTGQVNALCNIGNVYNEQGNYPAALDYQLKALNLAEEVKDKHKQAIILGNLGNIYQSQKEYAKALDYDTRALKIGREISDNYAISLNLGDIANVYNAEGKLDSALMFDRQAIVINDSTGDMEGKAINLTNIGSIFESWNKVDSALKYYQQANAIGEQMGDKEIEAATLCNIGNLYTRKGNYKEAEPYLIKAVAIDSTIGAKSELMQSDEFLSDLYERSGNYKSALVLYKKAMILKDTLFNIEKDKALTRKEVTYQYEKKEAQAKLDQERRDIKQKVITTAVAGGLGLALVFLVFILRSLRITQKQKVIIEHKQEETEQQKKLIEYQKALVEEKNKEVIDSITYAKRLQDAILPPLTIIKQYLPDSFLLYKPKDIVAGDFYWMERSGENILIAACDCTGHGVPGALVSVVCSNALNRELNEFNIRDTGKMLDKVRELVLETFEKSEGDVKDGMDCSFCAINIKTNRVEWSGAYNPLWYISDGKMNEITADKQPVGKIDNPKPFSTHVLNLKKGDCLYLFTDGYADQFGGPSGKKYKYKHLQEELIAISSLSMQEQGKTLDKSLEQWRGNLEQVDDVLMIGIRV